MPKKPSTTVDINTTDELILAKKLSISLRLAKRIIALRPYKSVDQLSKVWGIDAQLLDRIIPLVSVGEEETKKAEKLASGAVPVQKKRAKNIRPEEPQTTQIHVEEKNITSDSRSSKFLDLSFSSIFSQFRQREKSRWKLNYALIVILLIGACFRFTGLNWDDGHHQHPDERFISMVAEQIRGVDRLGGYFDTQNSPLNPLRFGSYTYGMLPLFLTRLVAVLTDKAQYDSVTLVGRAMSGVFDLIAVLMLYYLGKRLYDKRVGLLAAMLGVAAVLPIQLSHYFTVDSFSTIFVIASVYLATLAIPLHVPEEKISRFNLYYFGLFGVVVGMAGACKVNTLPIFGAIVLAGMAKLLMEWKSPDFRNVLNIILSGWVVSTVFVLLSFRIFQPYAFSGPAFFNVTINENWLRVMKEVIAQVGGDSDWPPNTHWTNRPASYAWMNMVTWGLGLPLGLAGWLGWGWAAGQMVNGKWQSHLLPFFWVTAYFIWQNSQFWRYMRYFLPIYPFIILFAAWALIEIYDRTSEGRSRIFANGMKVALQLSDWRFTWKAVLGSTILGVVLVGTYFYAIAFTQIYNRTMTRIAASEWMLENIPGPMNLIVESKDGKHPYPISVDNRQIVVPGETGYTNLNILQDGKVSEIKTNDVQQLGTNIYFRLTRDEGGNDFITDGRLGISDVNTDGKQTISFGNINLPSGQNYYFHYKIQGSGQLSLSNVSLQNSDQGEGSLLPVNLTIASQTPGVFEGSFSLQPDRPLILNRLVIEDFRQVFLPAETTIKIELYKSGEDNKVLGESTQTLVFPRPGLSLSPTFTFPSIEVVAGQSYQVRYTVTNGTPVRLLGEKFTLETSWDDALPLNINQYNVQGGIFTPLNLELYEPDTPEKRESMIKILAESNYIVIPSNRAYDAMPRLPLRYPLALKYYQTLFDCNCSGDALENRAYGLKPPFKSPLGFDLVAVFESPPSLGPIVFPDQSADESFTVYDHPKVFVFKKSDDFSIDRVSAILNTVNLDAVIFQTPMQYTRLPNGMQLPADRLSAQTNGGTWSEMFDRNSILNTNDLMSGLAWYLVLFLLGLTVLPFVFKVFSGLPDRGYPLIRMTGLILFAWLAWILGSLKILPFSQIYLWIYVGLILILGIFLAYLQRNDLASYFSSHWKHVLFTEVLFLLLFLFSMSVRLGNPDLWHPWLGGEKPMDFAFFNAVLKAVYFPPEHPWYSGNYINYYYYGYVIAAIPTKLLGVVPSIAYNLILPSWFAMTGTGLFCIGYNLVAGLRKSPVVLNIQNEPESSFLARLFSRNFFHANLPYLVGLIALVSVLFLGNLYEVRVLWKYLPEVVGGTNTSPFFDHMGDFVQGGIKVLTGASPLPGDKGRWFFEASRPILHDGPDTPIAEFPYFTFLYGDMHPHLLIMPFYALAFGWILNLLLWPLADAKWVNRIPGLFFAGLFFGVFRPSHTWDFPTFLGLGGLAIMWNVWSFRENTSMQKVFQLMITYGAAFAAVALLFYWPFAQWFKTEYASVEIWHGIRTPLIDYLFVFGIPIFLLISLLLRDIKLKFDYLISASIRELFSGKNMLYALGIAVVLYLMGALWLSDYQVLAFGVPLMVGAAYLILFNQELSMFRRLTLILFSIALFITLFVEVFVLKGDGGRSNTVFRFYNQAWFFYGLAVSLALADLIDESSKWLASVRSAWVVVLAILILCAASYPIIATGKKMADRWPDIKNPPHTLNGAAFMLGDTVSPGEKPAIYNDENRLLDLSLDYAGIQYMQDQIKGSPVLVEGNTVEYRWGSRYSIYTGLPSVVGWSWHVRQHNSLLDGAIVEKRINEVNNFYNTQSIQDAEQFLIHYKVKYIIVGGLERAYYAPEGIAKFDSMVKAGSLQIVFGQSSNTNTIVIYETIKP